MTVWFANQWHSCRAIEVFWIWNNKKRLTNTLGAVLWLIHYILFHKIYFTNDSCLWPKPHNVCPRDLVEQIVWSHIIEGRHKGHLNSSLFLWDTPYYDSRTFQKVERYPTVCCRVVSADINTASVTSVRVRVLVRACVSRPLSLCARSLSHITAERRFGITKPRPMTKADP